jgi:hypothetical protein
MKQSRISNRKLAVLTIAAVAVMVTIAVTVPSTETRITEKAPLPVINTDTIYFPSQYTNKAIGPSEPISSF